MSGSGSLFQEYPDQGYFDSFESRANCTSFLSTMASNNLSEMDHPCLFLLNTHLMETEMDDSHNFTGPPWWAQIVVQILYGLVFLIGLAGNTLVIYVVVRFSKMQTVTNLYIVNLAIADECFLIGIPFLMTTATLGYWPFGNFLCKAYFTSTSINQITSSLFLLIMSADRYLAVCHPISAPKWRTPLIAKTVALTAWTLSALLMVPIFMYANTLEIHKKINCNIFWPETESMSGEMIFIIYSFVLGFGVPLVLILMFYVLVIRRLRTVGPRGKVQGNRPKSSGSGQKESQQVQQQTNRAKDRKKSHARVTKLGWILGDRAREIFQSPRIWARRITPCGTANSFVLTVITVYFLCWAPYWFTQMALIFMPHDSSHSGTVLIVFLLAGCLSYSNSTMNPILYAFLSDNFKKSFKKACSCASRKEINATLNQENSVFPRKQNSHRQRKSSAPLTSATYAGTGMDTTGTTRSTGPSPHLASPMSTHVPVSKLIPDIEESSDNMATAEVNAAPVTSTTTAVVAPSPSVHITINDHYTADDYFRFSKPLSTFSDATSIGSINETFVQDNGVIVTAL